MRHARRLIATVVLLGAALFAGVGTANADSGWDPKAAQQTVIPADSYWQ